MVGKRQAITHKEAGVTRDINRAAVEYEGHTFYFLDTGGITDEGVFSKQISKLSYSALSQADIVLLLVSAEEITAEDEELIEFVRKITLPLLFVVNKVDNESREWTSSEYYRYGIGEPIMISALHRSNYEYLWDKIAESLDIDFKVEMDEHSGVQDIETIPNTSELTDQEFVDSNNTPISENQDSIRLLIMGKPNTGKSSLLNTMLGKYRTMVSDTPGTTRDIIEEEVEVNGEKFTIIDSAGIRKKNKIYEDVEYYSSHRAITAIESSDVILLMVDVMDGLSEQDKKLASLIVRQGKGLVIVLNKWDLIKIKENRLVAEKDRISYLVPQLNFVPVCPISAKNNTGLAQAIVQVKKVYAQLNIKINTSILNRDVQKWVTRNPPPVVNRRRGKLKFIAQSNNKPIVFQARVNNPKLFSESYTQYIINNIREKYQIKNVPIRLDLVYNA